VPPQCKGKWKRGEITLSVLAALGHLSQRERQGRDGRQSLGSPHGRKVTEGIHPEVTERACGAQPGHPLAGAFSPLTVGETPWEQNMGTEAWEQRPTNSYSAFYAVLHFSLLFLKIW